MTTIYTAQGKGFVLPGGFTATLAAMRTCQDHSGETLQWALGPAGSLIESRGRYVITARELSPPGRHGPVRKR